MDAAFVAAGWSVKSSRVENRRTSARWYCRDSTRPTGPKKKLQRFRKNVEVVVESNDLNNLENESLIAAAKELGRKKKFSLDSCPTLVLNADYQPLSYLPLSVWPWQEAVKAVFLDRVVILATYDFEIRSPSVSLELPSVVALKKYQQLGDKKPAFTRYNVFVRDDFTCQYCYKQFPTTDLTFDHVVPRSKGGKGGWKNVVTACIDCNYKKGSKLLHDIPDFRLLKKPIEPSNAQLQNCARKYRPKHLHSTWRDYVYWDLSLENHDED
eukprot:Plantae.Rhodophyta-Purpureofilum_apyrenoidigerum.ctg11703.p1 GENE.Plantae.Rhodophyta-Purpureofilum_apyrenoidigerum.ctg11703~~Plantae.Rhodophyta-Purpureofilum_apyrenoidigerum.ctg11703.p1  ORF type:complete len:268 (+),score=39.42 Plantae.Rhodophyta-Purpureofilum_apyrenoidigerum.ctg11703:278-1081(+)